MTSLSRKPLFPTVVVLVALATGAAEAAPKTLVVPTKYPTIQSAVDAASAGDRIKILPGTYVEQVSIDKDLVIRGSGAGSTVIRAPASLVAGQDGANSIVEIHSGASVTMSRLTVTGPGSGTCENGALENGILVLDESRLDLSFARVTRIHDTPVSDCFRSGNAIITVFSSANIRYTHVSDYQAAGIVIVGGTATISHNVVTGPGASPVVATGGIELVAGAVGTVSDNVVSGNACGSPDLGCGPDFFNEFQLAGITGGGPGTVISRNLLFGNQVGIYVGESAEIRRNLILHNDYFGIALQDGSFTVSKDVIVGGTGGVAVITAFADTEAVLDNVHIAGTSGAPVQEFECCGFTATTIGGPNGF